MKFKLICCLLLLSNFCFAQKDKLEFSAPQFTVQYPTDWRVDTSRLMGTELLLFSPLEGEGDLFAENVNVLIQDLSGQNIDLEKYKQITDAQLAVYANEGGVLESVIVKTGSSKCYIVHYTMSQGGLNLKILSTCIIKNEKAFLVTFSAEVDKYEQFKELGEGILSSFALTR